MQKCWYVSLTLLLTVICQSVGVKVFYWCLAISVYLVAAELERAWTKCSLPSSFRSQIVFLIRTEKRSCSFPRLFIFFMNTFWATVCSQFRSERYVRSKSRAWSELRNICSFVPVLSYLCFCSRWEWTGWRFTQRTWTRGRSSWTYRSGTP